MNVDARLLPSRSPAKGLRLYAILAGVMPISYRSKIMLIAFLGTHVPLLALVIWYTTSTSANFADAIRVIGVALIATLIGTGITLTVLHHLLRPILLTARALRLYTAARQLPALPTEFSDEAGVLMQDTVTTLSRLDNVLESLAYIDRVTGLPNRDHMVRHLTERLRSGKAIALCVVALQNADSIIAGFGEAGATVAQRLLADRLAAAAGPSAISARLDGLRFAFALEIPPTTVDLTARLETILAQLRPELQDGDMAVLPNLAIGVALAPNDATQAEALLNAAQSAVPTQAQDGPAFYSAETQATARQQMDLQRALRRALEQDEFSLHYQPVVQFIGDDGVATIIGAEALLRWHHPEHGLIPPWLFIPLAERNGLMDEIGLWVLKAGFQQLNRWDRAKLPPMRLAVNLSAGQFGDPRLVQMISDALGHYAIPPHRLEVEMTETAAMQDRDATRRIFGDLHSLGTTVAIDDFGTGYSTMSHLRDLHFDTLKIDREFVRDIGSSRSGQAICKALIELGRGLDIEVLAEGVEHVGEVAELRRLGCHMFQGYYFGRPITGDAFGTLLREQAMTPVLV